MKRNKKRALIPNRFLMPAVALLLFLFLFYGPLKSFRLLWINTAMYSSRFKFLARCLYTEKYINRVLEQNAPAYDRRTDGRKIAHRWDGEILFKEINGNRYKGYIIKINDPRRLIFARAAAPEGNLLEQITQAYKAAGGINASGFADERRRGTVWGFTIENGRLISSLSRGDLHTMGGFTADYKLTVGRFTEEEITTQQYLWAFEFGPLLIVNGEKTEFTPFSGGLSPRTAIGQTAQGHVLLVAVDGRQTASIGVTLQELQTILFENGAVNAINLDGGSSTTMVYQGKVVNRPSDGDKERLLPNAILFW